MKNELITAEEARIISNGNNVMNDIMIQIKDAASKGRKAILSQIPNDKEIFQLRELGYQTIVEIDRTNNRYLLISW